MFSKKRAESFFRATVQYTNFLDALQAGINIAIGDEPDYKGKGLKVRTEIVMLKERLNARKIKEDGFLYVKTEEGEFKIQTKYKAIIYLHEEIKSLDNFMELIGSSTVNIETKAFIKEYEEIIE